MWAAEIVIEKRKNNPDIKLIMVIPHPDFEKRWNPDDRLLYDYAIRNADLVKLKSWILFGEYAFISKTERKTNMCIKMD